MIADDRLSTIIRETRDMCLSQYKDDTDLLTERSERLGHSFSEPNDYLQTRISQPIHQLSQLIESPRLLKTILRQVIEKWRTLHGEIDFDDLLVATVIRFTAPEAFDFLQDNFRTIRALKVDGIGNEKKERTEQLESKWERLKDRDWDHTTVRQLIGFLFPMWATLGLSSKPQAPQGVSVSEPTDYWMRLSIGDLRENEIRDQDIMRALKEWSHSDFRQMRLPEILTNEVQFAAKFEQFAPFLLNGSQLRELASAVFQLVLDRDGIKADRDSAPGFIPLWRCAIRQPVDLEQHKRWILQEISHSLSRSLKFANELFYWWGTNEESEVRIGKDRQDLWAAVVTKAKQLYIDNPKLFLAVLDPAFMYSSYHFAALNSSPKQGGPGFNPKEWDWFAHLLVVAGDKDPNTIVPQMAVFVCKEEMTSGGFVSHFDEEQARQFFGEDFQEALVLLRKEIDVSKFSERERNLLATAQEGAKRDTY